MIPAVYDFASIRQYHDEIVEKKQAALAETPIVTIMARTHDADILGAILDDGPKPVESVYSGWHGYNKPVEPVSAITDPSHGKWWTHVEWHHDR